MFEIIEFTSKETLEFLGTKEKFWTRKDGWEYLFKIGRENTNENYSEKVACELAKLIKLPCAEYEFASYANGMQKLGVASKKISNTLIHGNQILGKFIKNYDKNATYKAKEYTLQSVYALMQQKKSTHNFVGYLVFDALIGNQDRHHENWGFIVENNILKLAPSFDHASGLASKVSELEAQKRLATKDKNYTIESFCSKATTPLL